MKKWKCCLTAIVIAAGSMLVGCQESSSAKPIEAMYIPAGEDGHLMVGEGTGNVFTVTMPDNIQDNNGKKISEEDLNRGDIVAIYGDEIMLESYPGQYPGVTKIKVVKEGKASDADQYQDILDEFWPEKDPGELPYLNIGYRASYGEVSAAATRGGYSWSYADKDGVEQNKTADSAAVTQWPDLPVMNVDGTTDMELYFDTKPEKVITTAFPAELSGESDPGAGAEAEVEEKDGNMLITADHGNAEQMVDYKTGEPHTAHTTNPVPLILVTSNKNLKLKSGGKLADLAPTMLDLMNLKKPEEMTGISLLDKE